MEIKSFLSKINSSSFIFSINSIWKHLSKKNKKKSILENFVLPILIFFILAALLSAFIKVTTLWLTGIAYASIGADLSSKVFRKTLLKPYHDHLKENTSEVISAITFNMDQVVGLINVIFKLLSSSISIFFLCSTLFIVDWQISFIALFIFSASYIISGIITKDKINENGKIIVKANQNQIRTLQEGIGGVREIILQKTQDIFYTIYRKHELQYRRKRAINGFYSSFPRYCLESTSVITVSLLGYFILLKNGNFTTVITTLGTIALASQKILPALQQLYNSWSNCRAVRPALEKILKILEKKDIHFKNPKDIQRIDVLKTIEAKNISFSYGIGLPKIIEKANFTIFQGDCIGIIGETGCGKTTLIDILMGLLEPISGELFLNGKNLNEDSNFEYKLSWMKSISHVPQDLFLLDASIEENIAFPLTSNKIDKDKIVWASEVACISNFIDNLPNKYSTFVGERGVRLSGGQKQRIGIARALYRDCKFMFFDEATSALDMRTEKNVIKSINNFKNKITLIMIAHRLDSLKNCNKIFKLNSKKIEIISPENISNV